MPASIYADVEGASSSAGREREREAFEKAIAAMRAARDAADDFSARREAVRSVQSLWGFLVKDLSSPANDLSEELKANLISIGLWVLRESDAIIAGRKSDWTPLIEINETVREGLSA